MLEVGTLAAAAGASGRLPENVTVKLLLLWVRLDGRRFTLATNWYRRFPRQRHLQHEPCSV